MSENNNIAVNESNSNNSIPEAKVIATDGKAYAVCPYCGAKRRMTGDEKFDKAYLGIHDVDLIEPGVQIYCEQCDKKYTIPKK